MSEPKVAGTSPQKVTLESGKPYFWCSCGHSANQPFCDGSHQALPADNAMSPTRFEVDEGRDGFLCLCKQTSTPPYCDGTHNKLDVG